MSILTIAIIGAGNLGSHHLQALTLINRKISIQVIDKFDNSLNKVKDMFASVSDNIIKIEFHKSISYLNPEIDVAIVATNSDVRRQVIEEILFTSNVKFFILEKVLFQKNEDYYYIQNLLANHNSKAWVNCPRRMVYFYKMLKEKLSISSSFEISISGSLWGLGCNSIHYIDLISYLVGESKGLFIDAKFLNDNLIPSKRNGFIEFTGTIEGSLSKCRHFSITSYPDDNAPFIISIISPKLNVTIKESEEKAWLSESAQNWITKELSFKIPYQSQLTNIVIQQLLDTGSCDLTEYNESVLLHVPLITALLYHLNKNEKEVELCPIT